MRAEMTQRFRIWIKAKQAGLIQASGIQAGQSQTALPQEMRPQRKTPARIIRYKGHRRCLPAGRYSCDSRKLAHYSGVGSCSGESCDMQGLKPDTKTASPTFSRIGLLPLKNLPTLM